MLHDIENRGDIQKLVEQFYQKLLEDPALNYLFDEVIKSSLEKHLGVIVDFWENILFQTGRYTGNTMLVHLDLHERYGLTEAHFNRWLFLFQETINELFEGEHADQAQKSAVSIAMVIQSKTKQLDLLSGNRPA